MVLHKTAHKAVQEDMALQGEIQVLQEHMALHRKAHDTAQEDMLRDSWGDYRHAHGNRMEETVCMRKGAEAGVRFLIL
eukprot:1159821-Pelagomonas_calceolata.AAC.1